jgi:hypothetical protein
MLLLQAMEALRDEIEDIEEALVESVRDAVTDRNKVRQYGDGWSVRGICVDCCL